MQEIATVVAARRGPKHLALVAGETRQPSGVVMPSTVLQFPPSDNGLLAWSLNFLNLITAAPTSYGLVAPDATAYGLIHTAYSDALAACDPNVRNKAAVVDKNTA